MTLLELIGKESDEEFRKAMGRERNILGGYTHNSLIGESDYQNLMKYCETARKIIEDILNRGFKKRDIEKCTQTLLEKGYCGYNRKLYLTHFKVAPWEEQLKIRAVPYADVMGVIGSKKTPLIKLINEEILLGMGEVGWNHRDTLLICKYNGINSPKFEGIVFCGGA